MLFNLRQNAVPLQYFFLLRYLPQCRSIVPPCVDSQGTMTGDDGFCLWLLRDLSDKPSHVTKMNIPRGGVAMLTGTGNIQPGGVVINFLFTFSGGKIIFWTETHAKYSNLIKS